MGLIETPGMKKRVRKDGSVAHYWVASSIIRDTKEFLPKTVRLHGDNETMANRCKILTVELREWVAGQQRILPKAFDGTIGSLIDVYMRTPQSSYSSIKHSTKLSYDWYLKMLDKSVGDRYLKQLNGLDFMQWYDELKQPKAEGGPERVRRAYGAIQLLRVLFKFGVIIDIPDCTRLTTILSTLRFRTCAPRTEFMTFEQCKTICDMAISKGMLSMALGQALQFELVFRQVDVIGTWSPAPDEEHGIIYKGKRWSGGLLWSHINDDGILTKITTKRGKEVSHDTKLHPYLQSMIAMVPAHDRIGPMLINETTGRPYVTYSYWQKWRKLADEAGMPRTLTNRDSRAGGITEGSDAGASIEDLRQAAAHADSKTTSRYNRNQISKSRNVARLRERHRNAT